MSFAIARTRYGRRLGRVFDRMAWPLVILALAWGHGHSVNRALEVARRPATTATSPTISRELPLEIKSARWYYMGTIGVCLALYLLQLSGRRKLERLGDDMEGLTTKVLHDQARAFGDIHAEATSIMSGDSEALHLARAIEEISRREQKKISDYMLLARNFDGYDSASLEEVNLSATAWRVIADHKTRTPGVELTCTTPAEDVILTAHRPLVSAILGNLVENAVKYTDSGRVSLAVAKDGNAAKIVVSDTGRGISAEDQKHIFERFYRSPSANDRPGSGLGLATVREIAEGRYHGKISCESTPGKGSTFTVTLPLRQPNRPFPFWKRR